MLVSQFSGMVYWTVSPLPWGKRPAIVWAEHHTTFGRWADGKCRKYTARGCCAHFNWCYAAFSQSDPEECLENEGCFHANTDLSLLPTFIFIFLVHCSSPMIFKNKSKLYLWRAAFLNYNGNYDISEFLIPGKHALMLLTWMIKPNEKQSHWKLRGIEIKYRWCCVIVSPKIHSSIKIWKYELYKVKMAICALQPTVHHQNTLYPPLFQKWQELLNQCGLHSFPE